MTSGGKLPYFSTEDAIDAAFADAIHDARPPARPAPRAGQVGVRLARDPGDARPDRRRVGEHAHRRRSTAARCTFADAARDNSDNAEAAEGGDIGWVAQGPARPRRREDAIFAAPIGKVSDPLTIDGDGTLPVPRDRTRRPASPTPSRRRRSRAPRSRSGTRSRRTNFDDHPRPGDRQPTADELTRAGRPARCWTRSSPRPASAGGSTRRRASRVVVAERLDRDARSSRPLPAPVVPASRGCARAVDGEPPRRRRCPGATAATARDPVAVLRRLYPADHPVGRFGRPDGTTVGALTAADLARAAVPRARSRRSPTSPRRGACPGSPPGSASPTAARGTASRPTSRCATTCSRRRTRSTTRSRPARRRSSRASSATCCSRSCSTRSSPRRRACST